MIAAPELLEEVLDELDDEELDDELEELLLDDDELLELELLPSPEGWPPQAQSISRVMPRSERFKTCMTVPCLRYFYFGNGIISIWLSLIVEKVTNPPGICHRFSNQ